MTPLRCAQELCVVRGWPVFPAGPDKAPCTPNGFKDAATDKAAVVGWFKQHPERLLAVPTGSMTGLLVIDIDPDGAAWYHDNAVRLQCGRVHKTRRGHHLLYRLPPATEIRCSAGRIAPGVDVRADGGYIVWWPAHGLEASGELDDIGPPPAWLLALLSGRRRVATPATLATSVQRVAGVARVAGGNGRVPEGRRNDYLVRFAGALVGQGTSGEALFHQVMAENVARLETPLSEEEIRRTILTSAARWAEQEVEAEDDDPEPLTRPVPPPGEYPLAALGEILAPAARRIAAVVQAPEALCGQSLLAAASLAAQAHADVLIDGRREPLSLWCLSIAESGERKTAADDIALRAHDEWEQAAQDRHRQEEVDHAAELAAWEEEKRALLKEKVVRLDKKRAIDSGIAASLQAMGEKPPPPMLPWILAASPTLEGLHRLYRDGQPSLGLFNNDAGEFLGGYTMGQEHRMKSAAGLSRLWDRGHFDRIRGSEASAKYFGRRLALHLMVQPVVAETILGDRLLNGQGFIARCLLASPATRIGARHYAPEDLTADPALRTYWRCMSALLARPPALREGTRNELAPRTLALAPGAKQEWIALHDEIEAAMRPGREYAGIHAAASKAPAQILRIAGVLTLVMDPDAGVIQAAVIEQAAALAQHALDEAVRLAGVNDIPEEIRHAQLLLGWCHASGIALLHSRAVLRLGPNSIRTKAAFDEAIRILEKARWAAPVPGGAEVEGRHRRRVWTIRQ